MVGVTLSPGMLAEARKLAALFSLSYSVIPPDVRPRALDRAWARLRPGGRLAVEPALLDIYFVNTVVKPTNGTC